MSKLNLWKITPAAPEEDPRWLDHKPARVLVIARSPAEARVLAAKEDHKPEEGGVGNESALEHSRFLDEKLYRVDKVAWREVKDPARERDSPGVLEWRRS